MSLKSTPELFPPPSALMSPPSRLWNSLKPGSNTGLMALTQGEAARNSLASASVQAGSVLEVQAGSAAVSNIASRKLNKVLFVIKLAFIFLFLSQDSAASFRNYRVGADEAALNSFTIDLPLVAVRRPVYEADCGRSFGNCPP